MIVRAYRGWMEAPNVGVKHRHLSGRSPNRSPPSYLRLRATRRKGIATLFGAVAAAGNQTGDLPMKRKWLLLTLMAGLVFVQSGWPADLMQGFSGVIWGTAIEDVRNLKETARSGDIHYYKRTEDFYDIAGVPLSDIVYGFFKGQYFAAYMKMPASPDAFAKIKRHLDTVYGDAREQLRVDQTVYIWDYIDVKIKLKQYGDQPDGKLAFYYVPLSTQANAARANPAKETIIQLETAEPEYDF
jgi:hypothetical protein